MTRVALFAAGLAGAFVAAFLVGAGLDVEKRTVAAAMAAHVESTAPAGLAVAEDGYRFESATVRLQAGRPTSFEFRIIGPDGRAVRDFDIEQERRLHLIVVRRELDSFQHVHPILRSNGTWAVQLQLPAGGVYRMFADFTVDGERRTLGRDLFVTGAGRVGRTPERYDVRLARDGDRVTFDIRSGGRRVQPEPYLGARGHLVVLREGDLAYLHGHADEDELAFDIPFERRSSYRLFVQFKVGGSVHTAPFGVRG